MSEPHQEVYPPIVERPENTPIGWSEPDPAIDQSEPVATFEP